MDINREKLEFKDSVNMNFRFLENHYGYKCISNSLYIVEYITNDAYVNFYHDRISYEITFRMGILPCEYNNQLYAEPVDIISFFNLKNYNIFYQASSKSGVLHVLNIFRDLIQNYAQDGLDGSVPFYENIAKKRSERNRSKYLLLKKKLKLQ